MKQYSVRCLMLATLTVALSAPTWAQEFDLGKSEFQSSCATCHGVDGKGKGPLSAQLKVPPTDLTVLAKNNNGTLPFDAVYQTIYGSKVIIAHGTRDMPIWGFRFTADPSKALNPTQSYSVFGALGVGELGGIPYDSEVVMRTRVLALIDYVNRIQEK